MTALVGVKMRNQDLEMYAHIAALEQELKEMKALGVRDICPITPNRIEVMEVFISRMKNSVKNVRALFCFSFLFCLYLEQAPKHNLFSIFMTFCLLLIF